MKRLFTLFVAMLMVLTVFAAPAAAADEISVYFNGQKMEFDVPPILLNDRTMVPMRAIFEALGASVSWDDYTDTATGLKDGKSVSVTIDRPEAYVSAEKVMLDQSPVILNDRTLVPLRFVSESYDAEVGWDDKTQTVTITADTTEKNTIYFQVPDCNDFSTWSADNGDSLNPAIMGTRASEAAGTVVPGGNATKKIIIPEDGTYTVFSKGKDFATNKPGARYYNIAVDGQMLEQKMGTHGKDGFHWQKAGTVTLTAGEHLIEIMDTSGFYARCSAVMLSTNLTEVPADDTAWEDTFGINSTSVTPAAVYPYWSQAEITAPQDTVTLENDSYKINFIKGFNNEKGAYVQNEFFIKKDGAWVKVKDATDKFGYLMMSADSSAHFSAKHTEGEIFKQTVTVDGVQYNFATKNFFRSGIPTWFIANNVQKISDTEVLLSYPQRNGTDISVTCSFDDLCKEPKFTLSAAFSKDGAYSFMFFSDDVISDSEFDSVTAPIVYMKQNVPANHAVYNEPLMYTPMAAYTKKTDNGLITAGLVVDPSSTVQDIAYNETSRFGYMLRNEDNNMQAALCAPIFGTENSNFKAGSTYTFSYRFIGGANEWYDTFKHVAEDIYNVKDIRTNYYSNLNDAIFNTTDYMSDDKYGGWCEKAIGYGYSEYPETESQSNVLIAPQRYLMTEDEDFLENRVVPTIAFALSRKNPHFTTDLTGKSALGKPDMVESPSWVDSSILTSLYQMSQGRMPYLLNYAVGSQASGNSLGSLSTQQTLYNVTKDEKFKQNALTIADNIVSVVEGQTGKFGAFILDTFNGSLAALTYAYELTGEQKYLGAAKKCGQQLLTALSSVGYQNGYDKNTYHVDPQATADVHVVANDNTNWFYRGTNPRWRVGLPYGEAGPLAGMTSIIKEADVPGWLCAPTGLSSEHIWPTPSNSNYIMMNTWAPYLLRIAHYTGDELFLAQARNAIIGRFSNYPGYYVERYYTDYMRKEFPYEGPEYSMIYCTHTPAFLAMLEDFLITESMMRSGKNVDFPIMENSGYAYFTSTQYGHRPGKMYDTDGLWLWNKRGVVSVDSVNIDYVAARKNGVMGIALMNEDLKDTTSVITLGDKAQGFTGTAKVFDKDGNKSEIAVNNGTFTITVPARGIMTVIMNIDGVTAPEYALDTLHYSTDVQKTMASHKNGKGYVIQMNPKEYFAYMYVTDQNLKSMTFDYEVNGTKNSVTVNEFPFETIVKVPSATAECTYKLTALDKDGNTVDYGSGTLAPLSNGADKDDVNATPISTKPSTPATNPGAAIPADGVKIDWGTNQNAQFKADRIGIASHIRIVTNKKAFPFEITEKTVFNNCKIASMFIDGNKKSITQISTVVNAEINGDTIILNVVSQSKFDVDSIKETYCTLYPETATDIKLLNAPGGVTEGTGTKDDKKKDETPAANTTIPADFKEFEPIVEAVGVGNNMLRVVISTKGFPFSIAENSLKGLKASGKVTSPDGSKSFTFTSEVNGNEIRDNGSIVIVIKKTEGMDLSLDGKWKVSNFKLFK